jgi:hypothetical protein
VIPIYTGFDEREEVGYHTFCSSVIHHATEPVEFIPLHLAHLTHVFGDVRDGTNAFTYSRFLVPHLNGYVGHAIFMDGCDMVVKDDIAKLWNLRDPFSAVQVVKHAYQTKHPRKYVGTQMEAENRDYPKKNWSSMMILNCAHFAWRQITPGSIEKMSGEELHTFSSIDERFIGGLPVEWNWLPDEYGENENAKLLHWTAGVPAFPKYREAPMSVDWFKANERITRATT